MIRHEADENLAERECEGPGYVVLMSCGSKDGDCNRGMLIIASVKRLSTFSCFSSFSVFYKGVAGSKPVTRGRLVNPAAGRDFFFWTS